MVYSEQLTSNYRRGAKVNLAIHGAGDFVCRTAKELAITTRRRIPMIVRGPDAQRSQKRYNGAIRYNGKQRWGLNEESIEDSVPARAVAAEAESDVVGGNGSKTKNRNPLADQRSRNSPLNNPALKFIASWRLARLDSPPCGR